MYSSTARTNSGGDELCFGPLALEIIKCFLHYILRARITIVPQTSLSDDSCSAIILINKHTTSLDLRIQFLKIKKDIR